MRLSRALLVLVLIAAVGLVGGYWYLRPAILTGTGYAAHNACAVTEIAGRSDPSTDLPPDPMDRFLRTKFEPGVVTSSALGILAAQKAWYTPGYGCTIADARPQFGEPTPVSGTNPLASQPTPPNANLSAALDRAFDDVVGTRGVVIVKDGQIIGERYAPGFDQNTPQLGWSMTKSVTNLLVGRLVAEGKVSLDDDHLRPEWTDERANITIRQLLQMTSGLAWDETYSLNTAVTRMLYSEPDMGAYVASQPLEHKPGTFAEYSTGSTNLLCSILAPDNGGADFPRRALFSPLGLESAVLEPDAAGTPACGSYMWATPRDWAAIGQFALDDGVWNGQRLLPEGWMAESVKTIDGNGAGYASGWWSNVNSSGMLMKPELPRDAYFAEGHDGQRMVIVPSEGLVVVRLGFTLDDNDQTPRLAADVLAALR